MSEVAKLEEVKVRCSACNAGLLMLLITGPNDIDPRTKKVFEWKVRANCPFCGDKSFIKTVKGTFCPAGYGIVKDDDYDDCVYSTLQEGFDTEGDTIVFKIVKANKDAKPQYR